MSASTKTISILIVDGYPVFRDGLRSSLEQNVEFDVVGEEADGRNAYKTCRKFAPDVMLVDPFMPGLNGLQCVSKFLEICPRTSIIITSDIDDPVDVQIALSEGASGYVLKTAPSIEFANAIRAAAHEGSYLPISLMQGLLEAAKRTRSTGNMFGLTIRELDILKELAIGSTNKDIARSLKISVRTVETHRQNIRQKTGTFATTDLVKIANKLGLTPEVLIEESAM